MALCLGLGVQNAGVGPSGKPVLFGPKPMVQRGVGCLSFFGRLLQQGAPHAETCRMGAEANLGFRV